MRAGSHYAEFEIAETPVIGIVRSMPNLDVAAYAGRYLNWFDSRLCPDFLLALQGIAARIDDWGNGNAHATVRVCNYNCRDGKVIWTDWERENTGFEEWEGMEASRSGDTVGMLLNLDEGTLTVYKSNRCLGVMKDGLSGSYCWCASVIEDDTVAIKRSKHPRA